MYRKALDSILQDICLSLSLLAIISPVSFDIFSTVLKVIQAAIDIASVKKYSLIYSLICDDTFETLKIGYSPFCTSVLLITKGDQRCKHCPNLASLELFLNQNSGFHLFTSKTNHDSVGYSVRKSYFKYIEAKNVNKAFVYIKDCNSSLRKVFEQKEPQEPHIGCCSIEEKSYRYIQNKILISQYFYL